MPAEVPAAKLTPAARKVYFANHALPDERARSLDNRADKFVPRDTPEIHVAFENLQIGGADAGEMDFDQGNLIASFRRKVGCLEA
jgi:hypothetical protein